MQGYEEFVDKFRPKLTTDDCYTPENVYTAVSSWVSDRYGINNGTFIRPFYPGGDYQRYDYPHNCVVVDNPPFSILAQIVGYYLKRGIKFFLFAPTLTLFAALNRGGVCAIPIGAPVTYANGAKVSTSFLTNLEKSLIVECSSSLYAAIKEADGYQKVELPKYDYPNNILTATRAARYSQYGVQYSVPARQALFVRAMDAQKAEKKVIFGSGLIISDDAAARHAAARQAAARQAAARQIKEWETSDREREIIKRLNTESSVL